MKKQTARPSPKKREGDSLWLFKVRGAGPVDRVLVALILVIQLFGLVMLFSVSYPSAYSQYEDSFHYIRSQAFFAVFGLSVMWVASYFRYRYLWALRWVIYFFTMALLVAVFFFTPPDEVAGYHRWFYIGGSTFQPSEIAKFSLTVICAYLGAKYYKKIRSSRFWGRATVFGVLVFIAVIVPYLGLVALEPHLSATVILLCIGIAVMYAAGLDGRWCALGVLVAGAGLTLVLLVMNQPEHPISQTLLSMLPEHAQPRIQLWKDPFSDPLGDGMQTVQGLYAIGSGGWTGLGIGSSRQKYLWVPEPYNDFIFAIVCEELGFIGALVILGLFAALVVRMYWISMRCPDRFGSLLGVGLATQIGVQVFFNVGVVTNLLPNTGISLPFFSYGGTSLVMLLGQMGIMLAISRTVPRQKETASESSSVQAQQKEETT